MSDVPREPRGEDTVDDDLLAAALAAELERFTPTGSVRTDAPPPPGQSPALASRRPRETAVRAAQPTVADPQTGPVAQPASEVSTDTGSTRRARIDAERAATRADRARAIAPSPPSAVQQSGPPTSLLQRLTEGPHPFTQPDAQPAADATRPHGRRARRPGEDTGPFTGPVPSPAQDAQPSAPVTGPTALRQPVAGDLTVTGPLPTVVPGFAADELGSAVTPTTGEVRVVRLPVDEDDDEGIDDVPVDVPAVSAATASVPLPPIVEAPPSAVVGSGTGSVAVVAARVPPQSPRASAFAWAGVFATPLTALLGFALAGAGAGGAAPVLMVAAVALTVPAVVRSVRRAAERGGGTVQVARDAFGAGGAVVAGLLLAVRVLVLVLALLATAGLAAAYGARTGAVGDGTVPAVAAVLVPALVAAVVGLLPRGAARVAQVVLAAVGLAGFLLAALLVASVGGGTARAGQGDVLATVAALGFVGLVTAGTAADLVGRTRGFGSPWRSAAAMVAALAVGLVLLVLALVSGAATASSGDPLDGFAGALADATSARLAVPIALALLAAATSLPTVLAGSIGRAAADLTPNGRSARLGAAAAALVAAAIALAVVAAGGTVGGVLSAAGPIAAVVLAAWSGTLTTAPLDASASAEAVRARGLLIVGAAVAVVVGLLLADGIGWPGERSPLLQLAGVADDAPIRAGSAVALVVVWLLAVAAGLVARFARMQHARSAAGDAERASS